MIYVISKNGKNLTPTNRHGKVRHLLNEKRAVIVSYNPFTIQLTYQEELYMPPRGDTKSRL